MLDLNHDTQDLWNSNAEAFKNCLIFKRKLIGYDKEFDSQFSQFLLENHKYQFYELKIRLESDEFEIFLDSVIKIDLKFTEISIPAIDTRTLRYRKIKELLIKHDIIDYLYEDNGLNYTGKLSFGNDVTYPQMWSYVPKYTLSS
jgi:hypothetical protein